MAFCALERRRTTFSMRRSPLDLFLRRPPWRTTLAAANFPVTASFLRIVILFTPRLKRISLMCFSSVSRGFGDGLFILIHGALHQSNQTRLLHAVWTETFELLPCAIPPSDKSARNTRRQRWPSRTQFPRRIQP